MAHWLYLLMRHNIFTLELHCVAELKRQKPFRLAQALRGGNDPPQGDETSTVIIGGHVSAGQKPSQ